MKKLFIVGAIGLSTLGAMGQSHLSQSFLNVGTLRLGTNTTTSMSIVSNAYTYPLQFTATNTLWTNAAGAQILVPGLTTTDTYTNAARFNVFKDVTFASGRDGWPLIQQFAGSAPGGSASNFTTFSANTLYLKVRGESGANSAVTFVFSPVWDGEGGSASINAPAITGDDWSVAVTAVTAATTTLATNVPMWRWPGAKGLRLSKVTNADTDGGAYAWLQEVKLLHFRP